MTDSAQNIQDPDHGFLRIQKNLTDRTSYSTLFRNLWLENLVVANTHGCLKSRTSLKVTSVLCRSTGDMRAVSYIWAPTRAMQNMAKRRESPVSWNTILKNERAICFQIQNPLFDIQVLYCTVHCTVYNCGEVRLILGSRIDASPWSTTGQEDRTVERKAGKRG